MQSSVLPLTENSTHGRNVENLCCMDCILVQNLTWPNATKQNPTKFTKERFRALHTQRRIYPLLTSMFLGFFGSGGGSLGTVTVSTPSWHAAEMASKLQSGGRVNFLMNFATLRSMRMYFTSPSSFSFLFRSPLMFRMFSSST